MESTEVTLKNHYYDASRAGSLGGVDALVKSVGLKKPAVSQWLSGEDAYTLHKPVRRKFYRRPVLVSTIGEQIQADLVDVGAHSRENQNIRFLLTIVDAFSRYAWVIPLKNKTGAEVAQAIENVLSIHSYRLLQTDKGKEFYNQRVSSVLKTHGTKHFSTENEDLKASIVERFNKTLRGKIHRIITKSVKGKYLDQLGSVVRGYNETIHRSTGFKPINITYENAHEVWFRLNERRAGFKSLPKKKKPKLKIGDHVRLARGKTTFERGYAQRWSIELFKIKQVHTNINPIVYEIVDAAETPIKGTFYEQELQKVAEPETYIVEKIVKTRRLRGKSQSLVKWLGYSDAFNSWVNNSDVKSR